MRSTVHIVDDDQDGCRALSRLVSFSGYSVTSYLSAAQFLDSVPAPAAGCGCILLAFQLPAMNGLSLQERLKRANSALPIIYVSRSATPIPSVHAMEEGVEGFLIKPVCASQLIPAIESALKISQRILLWRSAEGRLRRAA
jgi:FixJ family two-component response regulator